MERKEYTTKIQISCTDRIGADSDAWLVGKVIAGVALQFGSNERSAALFNADELPTVRDRLKAHAKVKAAVKAGNTPGWFEHEEVREFPTREQLLADWRKDSIERLTDLARQMNSAIRDMLSKSITLGLDVEGKPVIVSVNSDDFVYRAEHRILDWFETYEVSRWCDWALTEIGEAAGEDLYKKFEIAVQKVRASVIEMAHFNPSSTSQMDNMRETMKRTARCKILEIAEGIVGTYEWRVKYADSLDVRFGVDA